MQTYFKSPSFPHISPILRDMWDPYFFDYTDKIFAQLPIRDIDFMQSWNEKTLQDHQKKWGIAGYLEDRSLRLRWTHLLDEWRAYHLGIDIIAPAWTDIFSPLAWEIIESTIEWWSASYGWYLIVQYMLDNSIFYVLYGHLDPEFLHTLWPVETGELLSKIGSPDINGWWTTHLHMQVFTWKNFEEWKMKGYCKKEDIPKMQTICPDPSFLLCY